MQRSLLGPTRTSRSNQKHFFQVLRQCEKIFVFTNYDLNTLVPRTPLLQFQIYALSTLIWGREGGRRERVAYAKHCRAQVVQDYVRQLTRIDFLFKWEGSRTEAKSDQCEKGRRTIKWCRIMSDNSILNTCAAFVAWTNTHVQIQSKAFFSSAAAV